MAACLIRGLVVSDDLTDLAGAATVAAELPSSLDITHDPHTGLIDVNPGIDLSMAGSRVELQTTLRKYYRHNRIDTTGSERRNIE